MLTILQYNQKDLHELRDQLLQIQSTMKDGKLPDDHGDVKPAGQELVVPLLERCLKFTEIVEQKYYSAVSSLKRLKSLTLLPQARQDRRAIQGYLRQTSRDSKPT